MKWTAQVGASGMLVWALIVSPSNLLAIGIPSGEPFIVSPLAREYHALVSEYKSWQRLSQTPPLVWTNGAYQLGEVSHAETQEKFAARFVELARKNPKHPAAGDALHFALKIESDSRTRQTALDLLVQYHAGSTVLKTCEALGQSHSEAAEKQLREILAKNNHREVQAVGKLWLARMVKDKSPAEAAKLFAEVSEKFRSVKVDGDYPAKAAETEWFELRRAMKEPMEIEGEDVDGRRFKLSDYRGKVVMVIFGATSGKRAGQCTRTSGRSRPEWLAGRSRCWASPAIPRVSSSKSSSGKA